MLSERNQSKKTVYFMIPTIWASGKGKHIETLKRLLVSRDPRGRRKRQMKSLCIEDCHGGETIIYGTIKADIWYYTFSKPAELQHRVNPIVNYGLYSIIIYQYWFICCNERTTLMQDINRGNCFMGTL